MLPMSRRLPLKSARAWLAAAAAALALGTAQAAADPVAQDIDQRLQSLKTEAITLNRDLQAAELGMLYPEQSRTTLYVSVKVGGFLLDELTVRINELEPVSHTYNDTESRAFLKDGWHRLTRLRLEPGTYRLQGEFRGHFFDARPSDPPIKGKVEAVFEKGLSDLDLVLPISRNTRLDKPGMSELSRLEARRQRPTRNVWLPQPERFESALSADMHGSLNDPRYRSALFQRQDGRFLSALSELLEIEQTTPDPATLPGEYHLLLADCYLGFGLEAEAERRYRQIAAGRHDATTAARAQLQLALFEYQRGYFEQAVARLQRMADTLPSTLRDEWRLVLTSTLLAQDRYNEAAELLTKDGKADDLTPVLRYNLAVALMRDGRTGEGRRQLNLVGTMDVTNQDTLALRDKANLALGYQYLQVQQGKNARTVFGRIRTTGPFSNRALLGIGWAEIAPAAAPKGEATEEAEGKNTDDSLGTLLRPGYVDPKARDRLKVVPSATKLTVAEQEALQRALVPWVELAKRDPMDPAVQEGLLAIPWALDRLHAYEQSLTRYLDAIAALETARKRMDEAAKSIRGGRMVETIVRRDVDSEKGWQWRLRDLPDAPETYFLQSLLAEHRFQEQIKNYRDARLLTRNLDSWQTRLTELEQGGAAVHRSSAQRQLQRARANWQPVWSGTVVWLNLETALGAPGAYDAPLTDVPEAPVDLRTLEPPAAFEGAIEALKPLRARINELRPRIGAAATAQDNQLEAVSLKELEGQKRQIERYLTEARFAVARIYDRQLQGGK
jgi:tetratricopeptide (TPR) repeat protein